jgi:voltage-gated potassium channel
MLPDLRAALFVVLNPTEHRPLAAKAAKALLLLAIAGSVVAAAWITIPNIGPETRAVLGMISTAAFAIFTLEYVARLFSASGRDPDAKAHPVLVTWDYVRSPLGLIDGLVVLPQILHALGVLEPGAARLAAVLAVVKVARYAPALTLVTTVLRNEGRSLLAALTVMMVLLILTASVMFMLENEAQPQLFSSIPATLWWSIVTIASVGYGDMTPITIGGRIFAGCTMLLGIAMFAVPAGILATGFATEIRRRDFVVTWNTVARVPLFSGLDATGIAAIARLLKPQIAPAHFAIVRRGEPATAMFFIMSGEVVVDVLPHPVHLRGGQFFGEIALLKETLRTATVTALTETQLLGLDAEDFRKLIDQYPDLKEKIHRIAESRLNTRMDTPVPPAAGEPAPPRQPT